MEEIQNQPAVASTSRVYKPSYTIEFNREGEVLLYSANPVDKETIYFKYPYIFCNLFTMAQINRLLHSWCSIIFSTRSIWCGIGPVLDCMAAFSCSPQGSGISQISSTILPNFSYSAAAECSKWRPRTSEVTGSRTGSKPSL